MERIIRIIVFFLKNFSINRVIWFSQVVEKFLFSISWLLSPILFTHETVMSVLQYSTSSTLYYKQIDLFFHCRNMWILNSETMAQTRNSHWKTFRPCTKGNNQDIMFPFLTLILLYFLYYQVAVFWPFLLNLTSLTILSIFTGPRNLEKNSLVTNLDQIPIFWKDWEKIYSVNTYHLTSSGCHLAAS